jgi:hypothetical protein
VGNGSTRSLRGTRSRTADRPADLSTRRETDERFAAPTRSRRFCTVARASSCYRPGSLRPAAEREASRWLFRPESQRVLGHSGSAARYRGAPLVHPSAGPCLAARACHLVFIAQCQPRCSRLGSTPAHPSPSSSQPTSSSGRSRAEDPCDPTTDFFLARSLVFPVGEGRRATSARSSTAPCGAARLLGTGSSRVFCSPSTRSEKLAACCRLSREQAQYAPWI